MRAAAAGVSIGTGLLAALGFVGGVCAMALVAGLCATFCARHNRVESKDSISEGGNLPSTSKSTKKWFNLSLSSKRLLSMDKPKSTTTTENTSPKKWLNLSLSSKRLLDSMKKTKSTTTPEDTLKAYELNSMEEGGLDSPVWQRSILMGERCEPPAFSGLILYDEHGNRVEDFPFKSPARAAHTPPSRVQVTVN